MKNIIRVCGAYSLPVGIATSVYCFAFFETGVALPRAEFVGRTSAGGRTYNAGLVAQRQNGLIVGFALDAIGAGQRSAGRGGRERPGRKREEMPVLRRASEGRGQRVPALAARSTPVATACAVFQPVTRAKTEVIP